MRNWLIRGKISLINTRPADSDAAVTPGVKRKHPGGRPHLWMETRPFMKGAPLKFTRRGIRSLLGIFPLECWGSHPQRGAALRALQAAGRGRSGEGAEVGKVTPASAPL